MTTTERPETTTTGSPPSRTRRVVDAVDERLGIKALEYPVPEHANNLAWSLGGITAGWDRVAVATSFKITMLEGKNSERVSKDLWDMPINFMLL